MNISERVDALLTKVDSLETKVQNLIDHPTAATVDPAALAPITQGIADLKVDLGDVAVAAAPAEQSQS